MSTPNTNDVKHWFNGLPVTGLKQLARAGETKYWFNGLPIESLSTPVIPRFFVVFIQ